MNEFTVDSSLNKPRLECLDENWKRVKFDFWTFLKFRNKNHFKFFCSNDVVADKKFSWDRFSKKSSAVECNFSSLQSP